jgi:hypothetical protein
VCGPGSLRSISTPEAGLGQFWRRPVCFNPLCVISHQLRQGRIMHFLHEGLSPQPHSWTCSLSGSPPDFELILLFLTYRLRLRLRKTLHLLSTELLRLGNGLTPGKNFRVNRNLFGNADIRRLNTSEPDFPGNHEISDVFTPRDAV